MHNLFLQEQLVSTLSPFQKNCKKSKEKKKKTFYADKMFTFLKKENQFSKKKKQKTKSKKKHHCFQTCSITAGTDLGS